MKILCCWFFRISLFSCIIFSVVFQILSKMDGLVNLQNVLVVGMTNRKELLDEALLRPGRMEVNPQRLRMCFSNQSRMELVSLVFATTRVFCRPIISSICRWRYHRFFFSPREIPVGCAVHMGPDACIGFSCWGWFRLWFSSLLPFAPQFSWPTTAIISANTPGVRRTLFFREKARPFKRQTTDYPGGAIKLFGFQSRQHILAARGVLVKGGVPSIVLQRFVLALVVEQSIWTEDLKHSFPSLPPPPKNANSLFPLPSTSPSLSLS